MAQPAPFDFAGTKMADGQLSGKTAIVTGAGRGLGRSMALGLAHAGAGVVITAARHREEIDRVAEEAANIAGAGAIRALVADVTKEEDCQRILDEAVQAFGAVHILVNNAGRGMRFVSERFFDTATNFWETDPAVWRMIVDTNVMARFGSGKRGYGQPLRCQALGQLAPPRACCRESALPHSLSQS